MFLIIFILAICLNIAAAAETLKWPIQKISDLTSSEQKVVEWVKKYTVPNTLDKNGNPWTTKSLPAAVTYDQSIKPAAYAAAIVTAWSVYEGVYDIHDFYRLKDDKARCGCFEFPAQLPPKSDFPLQVFSYSNCQGQAVHLDSKTGQSRTSCDCSCTDCDAGGRLIGPNQRCRGRKLRPGEADWQNGIFGMEQGNVASAEDVAGRAQKIYHKLRGNVYTYVDVLDNTLRVAGFESGTEVYDTVMRCFPVDAATKKRKALDAGDLTWACADLVSLWLTRNHLVGLTVAMNDNPSFLAYPGNRSAILVLAKYFNQ
jgi:hypothetical protein